MLTAMNAELAALASNGVTLQLPELLQYQRFTYLLDLNPKQAIQSKLAGSYLAKSKGRGMEFDEVRHYQVGDDVRTIDWRVTARTGKVHTKLFREEKERPVFVLTDLTTSMQFGSVLLTKAVQAAHLAALIGWHAKARGDKFGGIVVNDAQIRELKPASRSIAVLRYLQQLIELCVLQQTQVQQPRLADACGQLRRLVRPGSLVYILSDFQRFDESTKRHVLAMAAHNEIRLCALQDPLELQVPNTRLGQIEVTDGERKLSLDLSSSQIQTQYQVQQMQMHEQQTLWCQRHGLRLLPISSAKPLREQLAGLLTSGASHA